MATTLTTLQNLILNYLNEDLDSIVGALPAGDGTTTLTTAQTLTQWINQWSGLFAKHCMALPDVGTYVLPMGSTTVPMTSVTMNNGGTLWCPQELSWNGVFLDEMGLGAIMVNYPGYLTSVLASGTPKVWYRDAQYQIGVVPSPSAGDTITVAGYCTPKSLSAGSDTIQGFTDDEVTYLAQAVAWFIAQKNLSDQNLQLRVAPWKLGAEAGMQAMYTRLITNPTTRAIAASYFSAPSSLDTITEATPNG